MEQELLGCPCCDSQPFYANGNLAINQEGVWWFVLCPKCGLCGPADLGKSGAIERWNIRPREAALSEALKAFSMEDIKAKMDRIIELTQELKGGSL